MVELINACQKSFDRKHFKCHPNLCCCRRTVGELRGEVTVVAQEPNPLGGGAALGTSRGLQEELGTRALSPHILPPWAAG